jgi:hypothetical protein
LAHLGRRANLPAGGESRLLPDSRRAAGYPKIDGTACDRRRVLSATPLLWTLVQTLAGGGTASGSFVYDATTNTYSNVNITTTAGTLPGATYSFVAPGPQNVFGLTVVTTSGANQTGNPGLQLQFVGGLLAAGGAGIPVLLREGTCQDAGCAANLGPLGPTVRTNTLGTLASSPLTAGQSQIPTLSEWGMAIFSILLMGTSSLYLRKTRQRGARG